MYIYSGPVYDWRKMTEEERAEAMRKRHLFSKGWHRPTDSPRGKWFHISAACFEHRPYIGICPERMTGFTDGLLNALDVASLEVSAWAVLPNHYHVLARVQDEAYLRKKLGRLHGRSSHDWNIQEGCTGRKCFHSLLAKPVASLAHRWATLNYIHHNPVKHGWVDRWQDWPYSSAHVYLQEMGREAVKRMWLEFPVLDMGKDWDD
jgi:putative transposase